MPIRIVTAVKTYSNHYEGATRDELDARRNEVAELAMEYGYR
jgi:hypothetical protein